MKVKRIQNKDGSELNELQNEQLAKLLAKTPFTEDEYVGFNLAITCNEIVGKNPPGNGMYIWRYSMKGRVFAAITQDHVLIVWPAIVAEIIQ